MRSHATPTPSGALERLREGANRFSKGDGLSRAGREQLARLAQSQAPFAVVLGCSDSRVAPELIFNCDLGELFVVRLAGNTVDDSALGSILYGVCVLGAPLVVVLGHARCGAVDAAVRIVTEGATFPEAMNGVLTPLAPAVDRALKSGAEDVVAAAVHENVSSVVGRLSTRQPLLSERLEDGRLEIVGAYYDLLTGQVEFFT